MSATRIVISGIIAAALGIGVGVCIGYFSHPGNFSESESESSYFQDLDISRLNEFDEQVDAMNIQENLKYFSETPHMATSPRDVELANYIKDTWRKQLDDAYLNPYEIMHGFLSEDEPNRVTVRDPNSDVNVFEARQKEILYPEYMANLSSIVPYFNAYGPPGTVQGKLVFANFGSDQDYVDLREKNVDLNGTISLVKYGGGVGRGGKARVAEKYGVIGVLVFSDPNNWVVEGEEGYPVDSSLPGTGVQRGSALSDFGDPSTPNYPSTEYAYRVKVEDMEGLPPIPLQPIAYDDAKYLLINLDGPVAPPTWTTGLTDNEIQVGPGFSSPNDTFEVRIEAHNTYVTTTSYNVIGIIRGSVEPDKYVMYGNHRDSWVYGAVDPSSGTSCMMEITRIYSNLLKEGWRPRRTIVFASWGSEEFGLIGSTEYAEEHFSLLNSRAVAYVNVDIAVYANVSFAAAASPLMSQVLFDAADIPDTKNPETTIKDIWIQNFPSPTTSNPQNPEIRRLGSGSDYGYFYQVIGIAAADLSFRKKTNISPYPTYHTAYDTFDYVERFVDPEFYAHQAVTRVAGNVLMRLADSLIIPFSLSYFSDLIQSQITATEEKFGKNMTDNDISLEFLKKAGTELKSAVSDFETYIHNTLDRKNLQEITSVNDRLLGFERCFIEPTGLPGQPFMRHVSGSSGLLDNSSGSFPGIQDAMYEALKNYENPKNWEIVNQQVSLATYKIKTAIKLLEL